MLCCFFLLLTKGIYANYRIKSIPAKLYFMFEISIDFINESAMKVFIVISTVGILTA